MMLSKSFVQQQPHKNSEFLIVVNPHPSKKGTHMCLKRPRLNPMGRNSVKGFCLTSWPQRMLTRPTAKTSLSRRGKCKSRVRNHSWILAVEEYLERKKRPLHVFARPQQYSESLPGQEFETRPVRERAEVCRPWVER